MNHRTYAYVGLLALLLSVAHADEPLPPPLPPPPPEFNVPCLFSEKELSPVLARQPARRAEQIDEHNNAICVYTMPTKTLRRLIVLVDTHYTAKRFAQRLKLAGRVAASRPIPLEGVGDEAFYVAGVAAARHGFNYVEITGLRQASGRHVRSSEAAALLRLALSRMP